jgi:D-alanine-D-alanine ligase
MIGIGGGRTSKRVAILYNLTERLEYGEYRDLKAEKSIIEEMRAVEDSVLELGYECCIMAIKDDILPVITWLKKIRPLCVINLCESVYGNSAMEMNVPALLDLMRIPYTGNGPMALGTCVNKGLVKDRLRAHGIQTPDYAVFTEKTIIKRPLIGFPMIVKPLHEDGSLGVTWKNVVYGVDTLEYMIGYILDTYHQPALVEKYIEGRELQVMILDIGGKPTALPISEIDYSHFPREKPPICSYEAKWEFDSDECKTSTPVCPATITQELSEELQIIGLQVYKLMGCKSYARMDTRVNSEIYVIELNPNMDISPGSGASNTMRAAGLSYTDFVKIIIDGAINDF